LTFKLETEGIQNVSNKSSLRWVGFGKKEHICLVTDEQNALTYLNINNHHV